MKNTMIEASEASWFGKKGLVDLSEIKAKVGTNISVLKVRSNKTGNIRVFLLKNIIRSQGETVGWFLKSGYLELMVIND